VIWPPTKIMRDY
jgi:hypothetical protein